MKKPRYFNYYLVIITAPSARFPVVFICFALCFHLFRAFVNARGTFSKKGHLVPQFNCLLSQKHTQIKTIIWLHKTLQEVNFLSHKLPKKWILVRGFPSSLWRPQYVKKNIWSHKWSVPSWSVSKFSRFDSKLWSGLPASAGSASVHSEVTSLTSASVTVVDNQIYDHCRRPVGRSAAWCGGIKGNTLMTGREGSIQSSQLKLILVSTPTEGYWPICIKYIWQ